MRAEVFFVSFPKCGRTWVNFFLKEYFSHASPGGPGPEVCFTHDRWQQERLRSWWERASGRSMVPAQARRTKKIILMVRDPRDVVVSLHFHLSKRSHSLRWEPAPFPEMLRDPFYGIRSVVDLMNGWLAEWQGRRTFMLLRYEDCRVDTAKEFRGLLEFIGVTKVDETAFARAVEASSFEKMQEQEASGRQKKGELAPGDVRDKDSFKARRGKVGGYVDYFSPADLEFASQEMARLDPKLGYKP